MTEWRPFEPSRDNEHLARVARHAMQFDEPVFGVVSAFNPETCKGIVTPDGWSPEYFHSTSFQASTQRWPYVGERVEIVYNQRGQLLAVHAVEP